MNCFFDVKTKELYLKNKEFGPCEFLYPKNILMWKVDLSND